MSGAGDSAYDAIVVGTGPGGASVAKALSDPGHKILILEMGGGEPVNGTIWQGITTSFWPGRGLLFTPQMLSLVRGIAVGGSSIPYYACVFDPPYEMFDSYGIDLRSEVAELKEELPIAPLSDDLVGPAAKRIMDSAHDLGYEWNKLPKLVYQDKCRPNCDKCLVGCPYGAKWTSRMYIEAACEAGAVLLTEAEVKRVIKNHQKAEGVEFTRRGRQHRAFAKVIVLAAGGIGTPQILRNSGIDHAGADYFFDPLVVAMGIIDDLDGGKEFPMTAGHHFHEDGYVLTDLGSPRWAYWLFAAVPRIDRLHLHSRIAPIMVKVKDELGGRITGRGGVRKELGEADRGKLTGGYEIAQKILRNAGARQVFKSKYLATHPGGTAKINEVVDSNLESEIDNLFVCDCSVIPEAWGLPPTMTLLALGRRLGKHLAAGEAYNSV